MPTIKNLFIYLLLIFAPPLSAEVLISPVDAMKYAYGQNSEVSQDNILLSSEQESKISQEAQTVVDTKIFKVFKAVTENKTLGYGILINKKSSFKKRCDSLHDYERVHIKRYRNHSL